MCAFAAVAPIVRFNDLEILATPTFFFASDFRSRTSDEVHARLTTFFFLAKSRFLFWNRACVTTSCNAPSFIGHFILFLNGRLRFTDDASLLEQAQKSSIWRAKSIAFAFNMSIARDIYSRLADFLHESWPMVKPVLFAALVCAAPVCSSAQ
jgi:hypothetical protein